MKHKARKRFGQNFLHDPAIIQRIVRVVNPQPGQRLVEIGPGKGAITLPLLAVCKHLEVIELDRDLVRPLAEKAMPFGELVIHQQDALRFDFAALADGERVRTVGNLPYNISTPLLFHLITQSGSIQDMHFMLQKEVVDRMAAVPGSRDYGRLSVMIQYHCKVEPLFGVGPGAFQPAPRVDSAFVRLTPWSQPPVVVKDAECLATLVRQAFSQRRKTLRNTLKGLLSEQAIRATGTDPSVRPESISLEQYAALANQLADKT
ncbi:MAG: 16S rRNA (adenine(1518)-N(6)/adenine(1519)-N(6)) -dimethyltransferase RsmA [Gammaproteobacteria bacterium]|nr:MAG: 16S rRNA (adenine(1518)-N(6)/adenine(1519)-N(6)) -dimethyltransferase RsmA [Gammaproteobacteria bacterium]